MTDVNMIADADWDPFPSGRTVSLDIDGLILSECSEAVCNTEILQNFYSVILSRDEKTQNLKGKMIFDSRKVDYSELYNSLYAIRESDSENSRYSIASGDCKINIVCTVSDYVITEQDYEVPIEIQMMDIECRGEGDPGVTEYFLNAPDVSASDVRKSVILCNDDSDEKPILIPLMVQGHRASLGDYEFGIWNGFNVSQLENSAFIEYYQDTPEYVRQEIQDFTSYLFGSKTIKIAEKIQKDEKLIIRCFSPGEESRYFYCRESCPFKRISAECFFGELFDKYLAKFSMIYEPYQIHRFLTSYWRALSSPKETAVLLFQVANDIVIEAFNKITNKMYIMNEEEITKKFGEELDALNNKILEKMGKEGAPIIDSVRDSFKKSRNTLIREFNSSLSIPISRDEKKLIKNTNKIRHGHKMSEKEINDGYLFHLTYCNRILLSLMGEKSYYYDYAAERSVYPGRESSSDVNGPAQ